MKDAIKLSIEKEEYELKKRKFSTGNEGYGLYGKMIIDKEEYQVSINIVKIQVKKK